MASFWYAKCRKLSHCELHCVLKVIFLVSRLFSIIMIETYNIIINHPWCLVVDMLRKWDPSQKGGVDEVDREAASLAMITV